MPRPSRYGVAVNQINAPAFHAKKYVRVRKVRKEGKYGGKTFIETITTTIIILKDRVVKEVKKTIQVIKK